MGAVKSTAVQHVKGSTSDESERLPWFLADPKPHDGALESKWLETRRADGSTLVLFSGAHGISPKPCIDTGDTQLELLYGGREEPSQTGIVEARATRGYRLASHKSVNTC